MAQIGTGLVEMIVMPNYLLDYKRPGMSHVPFLR